MNAPAAWPIDKVERWPLDRLLPYARNARMHSAEQVDQVAASIREWGWTNPVLIADDGQIIAGHCRVLAAKTLGLAQVPVILATNWTDAQKRAYVLADNQLTLNGTWNPDLLRVELGELKALEFDLGLIGFDAGQLMAIEVTGKGENDVFEEWTGMPECAQNKLTPHRSILVHFRSDADVAAFAAAINRTITPDTRSFWHPPIEREPYYDKQYTTAEAAE